MLEEPTFIEGTEREDITQYEASPTLAQFHNSDAFIRALLGPFGSGKSVGCCWEILRRAMEMPACISGPNKGKKVSRWLVTRNTYGELQDTTMKTWFEWFPKHLGTWGETKMTHTLEFDGVEMEVMFRALDRPDHLAKLLSLELTGAWLNEAREQPLPIFEGIQGRVGRYPPIKDLYTEEQQRVYGDAVEAYQRGEGPLPPKPYFDCVILDTNMPDEDHWIPGMLDPDMPVPAGAHYRKMEGVGFFVQPSGLSPNAENLRNLKPGYYQNLASGKSPEWINVYINARYGFVVDGKPVYSEYQPHIHEDDTIDVVPGEPVYIGLDFGLTPAATFRQQINGQWRALDEIVTTRMTMEPFADEIKDMYRRRYSKCPIGAITGDPAGNAQSATREDENCFRVLAAKGVTALPAFTNDFTIRRESVAQPMLRLHLGGKALFVVGPRCKMLRKAYRGGYQYKRLQVSGDDRFQDKPNKNIYSHVAEADQYCALGAGAATPVTSSHHDEAHVRQRVARMQVKRSIQTGKRK